MRTYEFKLRPNRVQDNALWKVLKLTRELYNLGLQELITSYELTGKSMSLFTQDKLHGKKEHPDLPAVLVDTTLKRLHQSFSNFFRRCKEGAAKKGFPRFKSANRWHSIQFRDAKTNGISDTYFKAGKILGGNIRFNRHRKIEGVIKFCRIIRRASGWFLQVVCEMDTIILSSTGKNVGLDFGLIYLVADSDGHKIENPRHLKRSLRRLKIAQRRISKRRKGSSRRKKACRLVSKIHEHIANQRKDYLHKVARRYVNSYDVIGLEDLNIVSMLKNSRLSRSISDVSWSHLRRLIEDKAAKAGRQVVIVPAHYTSQKCAECGEIEAKALNVRTHNCLHCGNIECRDINAAKNILTLALKKLASQTAGIQRSGRVFS